MQPAKNSNLYPHNREIPSLAIPVTYRQEWQDGFGARGWKLDCALDDTHVIAATPETGCQINTSVLVHDILDHHLSGFPLSGHRNEAMALIQLASRTRADPRPDYEQMVDEDLMRGTVSGESFRSFLPGHLVDLLPADSLSGKEIVEFLTEKTGKEYLRTALVEQFFALGRQGVPMARANWQKHGLEYDRREAFGLCLQKLLVWGDSIVQAGNYRQAGGAFMINSAFFQLHIQSPHAHTHEETVTPAK